MPFAKPTAVALAAVLTLVAVPATRAADEISTPAAKIDCGLDALPHYTEWNAPWLYATPAESVDDGLEAMPAMSSVSEASPFATPAAKVDSGLGDIVAAAATARR